MAVADIPKRGRHGEIAGYEGRYIWLLGICAFAFALIGLRLWHLQVLEGERYYQASTQNIIRQVELPPSRGLILDRNGVVLAENRPSFDVYIEPLIFLRHANDEVYGLLQQYLHLSDSDMARLRQRVDARSGEVLVKADVARADIARIEEDKMRLPGVEVRPQAQRHYPLHHVGAHALGFVAEVNPTELLELRRFGYRPGTYVGRMGLEQAFDEVLHGSPGIQRRAVDARGNPLGEAETRFLIGEYQEVKPVPGRDVVTTLDADLMVIIDEAMEAYPAGAVVAIDPRDGSVLAMYSKPHFNPNAWSGRLSSMEKMRSDNDPFRPMLDKTISAYFPGSVYKIVGALAALDEGGYEPHDEINCPGHYRLGNRRFRCWRDRGHGPMSATEALAQSCDVYYYKLADEMGIDKLAEYARLFGFGEASGIVLPREAVGRVPDREWYRQYGAEGYQRGMDLSTVIGQGDTLATPLQVALAYGAIANGGDLYYPRLVKEVQNSQGHSLFEYQPRVRKRIEMEPAHLETLREGLRMTVHDSSGSAWASRLEHTEVAGKTGTAQVAKIGRVRISNEERALRQRHHAWYTAYAPFDDPEIVVTVFLEHGGGGAGNAAPVGMEILDRYLTRESDKALATRVGQSFWQGDEP